MLIKKDDNGDKSLVLNSILNVIKQSCHIVIPLIVYPYVFRILGATNLGKYSFADSVTSILIILSSMGIPTYAVREGARIRKEPDSIKVFAAEIYSINIFWLAFVIAILFLLVSYVPRLNRDSALILFLSINIITNVLGREWINSIYEDYFFITVRHVFF